MEAGGGWWAGMGGERARPLAALGMTVGALGMIVAVLGGLLACEGTLPTLRGQMEVGRDAYAVFVAGTAVAGGDLYAVRTEGGVAVPITFTNVGEMRPVLSPDGGAVV